MSKWKMVVALLALAALAAWPVVSVKAQSVTQDGQSTRGVQQAILGGNLDPSDSSMAADRGTIPDGKWVYVTNSLNANQRVIANVYNDTLSLNGRSLDSLSAPVDVSDLKSIAVHFKMMGHHGANAGKVRIAVSAWFLGQAANDTVLTWSTNLRQTTASVTPDSVGAIGGEPAAGAAWPLETVVVLQNFATTTTSSGGSHHMVRTATLPIRNNGAKYLWLKFRVLSDTGTSASQGYKFYLRVDMEGSSL